MIRDDEKFMQRYTKTMASTCDAQVPVFSRVGRGLQGDSYEVNKSTDDGRIRLIGTRVDHASGASIREWEVDLSAMWPYLYYRVYEAVRQVEDSYFKGWYIEWAYKLPDTNKFIFRFKTPFTPTVPYTPSGSVPNDHLIEGNF